MPRPPLAGLVRTGCAVPIGNVRLGDQSMVIDRTASPAVAATCART